MRQLNAKIIIAIVFIAALSLYFLYRPHAAQVLDKDPAETDGLHSSAANAHSSDVSYSQNAAPSPVSTDATSADSTDSNTAEKEARFKTWLSAEAKNLDQPHVDTKQKDLELKKMMENLAEPEKQIVLNSVHDTSRPVNERILSTYLLVLDQSQGSIDHLSTVAKKALPDFGPINAHSEAEIRRGQELAVRYMALDELAKRGASDPTAVESLRNLAQNGESAEIRGYAQKLLKEIK